MINIKKIKRLIILGFASFLVVNLFIIISFEQDYSFLVNKFNPYPLTQTSSHSPISINGEGGFTSANGVKNESALGTKIDPFIIENWSISTSGSYGIEISHTMAHVIVRNCEIIRGDDNSGNGIYLNNATNVIIRNNTIHGFSDGIEIYKSFNNTVELNKVWDEIRGITLDESYNCTVQQNYANGHYWSGIRLDNSNDSLIIDNEVENSSQGIFILSSVDCRIVDNYCHHNEKYGVQFSLGNSNNTVRLNSLIKNYEYGIFLYSNQDNHVFNNDLSLNGYGPLHYSTGYTDNVHDNTLKRSNEMQTSNYPDIIFSESPTTYFVEFILSTFDTTAGPYQLKFSFVIEKNEGDTYTVFMIANIYTTTDNYITNTGADFIFDLTLTFNGNQHIAFGHRYDSTSIIEFSANLYYFPMCFQDIAETSDDITIIVNFNYELQSSQWNNFNSTFSETIVPTFADTEDSAISGFPILIINLIFVAIIIIKVKKSKIVRS